MNRKKESTKDRKYRSVKITAVCLILLFIILAVCTMKFAEMSYVLDYDPYYVMEVSEINGREISLISGKNAYGDTLSDAVVSKFGYFLPLYEGQKVIVEPDDGRLQLSDTPVEMFFTFIGLSLLSAGVLAFAVIYPKRRLRVE